MPLLYWKIMRGHMLPQYLQTSADKNITYSVWKKILYGIIGQRVEALFYIRLRCCQLKPLRARHWDLKLVFIFKFK